MTLIGSIWLKSLEAFELLFVLSVLFDSVSSVVFDSKVLSVLFDSVSSVVFDSVSSVVFDYEFEVLLDSVSSEALIESLPKVLDF